MAKPRTTFTVQRTEWHNDHLVRVYLGGRGFSSFCPNDFCDSYVKLLFACDGGEARRTYTIRSVDPVAEEIAIDFVYHGDEGLAGPWAASARPGDTIDAIGPGGGYAPRSDADWHLLAGDEAALPAISVALARMPREAVGQVFVEVCGPADELALDGPAGVQLTWLHRGDRVPGELLSSAVRAAAWPEGQVHVFIHGEAGAVMHDLRGYVRRERGVSAEWASISGYWRYGDTDERFRQWKSSFNAELAREDANRVA